MHRKIAKKKLLLNRETLRALNPKNLTLVVGGRSSNCDDSGGESTCPECTSD
jgi:hypothetical protein